MSTTKSIPKSSPNKKRKINELIDYWQLPKVIARAELPEPLFLISNDTNNKNNSEKYDLKQEKLNSNTISSKKNKNNENRLREKQRIEAAKEILSSEKNYVETLNSFVNV